MARTINIEEKQNLNVVHHFMCMYRYICVYVIGCASQRSTLSIVLQVSTTLICVHLYVCVQVQACPHPCVHMWRPEVNVRYLSPLLYSLHFWERVLLVSWPVVPWNLISPWPTSAGVTDMCCLAWLLHRFGGLKPGPHTCTANILPTEPSPQPPVSWFECLILSWYHHVERFWKLWVVGTS